MDETEADASFDMKAFNSSDAGVLDNVQSQIGMDSIYYNMTGDKYLFIFNHYRFKASRYFGFKRPTSRQGTMEDANKLNLIFKDLGYNVIIYRDFKHVEILETIKEISKRDHKGTSCLCFAFLTHGGCGGDIFAADRPYQFRDVTVLLENGHDSLVGKPKLFFIQACRGGETDSGRRVELDGNQASIIIPTHADFLVLYSSVEGYLSYRDTDGSFLIQELCDVIKEYHRVWDILQIVTLVHKRVAYYRTTYAPQKLSIHDMKQMPETRFTLTKLFKF